MLTCRNLRCDECPLCYACSDRGLKKWLETEYGEEVLLGKGQPEEKSGDSNDELESPAYKKGYEDGRNEVFSELSNIFKRK